jgi:hypothetical protein
VMLKFSFQQGKYSSNMHFLVSLSSFCKMTISNSMAKETQNWAVTKCPTHSIFFVRFVHGLHKRMGDRVKQGK